MCICVFVCMCMCVALLESNCLSLCVCKCVCPCWSPPPAWVPGPSSGYPRQDPVKLAHTYTHTHTHIHTNKVHTSRLCTQAQMLHTLTHTHTHTRIHTHTHACTHTRVFRIPGSKHSRSTFSESATMLELLAGPPPIISSSRSVPAHSYTCLCVWVLVWVLV